MARPLGSADARLAGSSAMSGPLDRMQALGAIVLWNSGHFDTLEIANLLNAKEDAICRTLHAARDVRREARG